MTKNPAQTKPGEDGVDEDEPAVRRSKQRAEIGHLGPAVAQGIADRILHPAVGQEDPEGREVRGEGDEDDGHGVGLLRELFPAEGPQPDEGRLEEEGGRRLDGQGRAEDVADVFERTRPSSSRTGTPW